MGFITRIYKKILLNIDLTKPTSLAYSLSTFALCWHALTVNPILPATIFHFSSSYSPKYFMSRASYILSFRIPWLLLLQLTTPSTLLSFSCTDLSKSVKECLETLLQYHLISTQKWTAEILPHPVLVDHCDENPILGVGVVAMSSTCTRSSVR